MKEIAENNLVRFINIVKKKDGLFATFKVKGIRNGMLFSATISVDLAACEVDPALDPLERIIDISAEKAVKEFKKADLRFEGIAHV